MNNRMGSLSLALSRLGLAFLWIMGRLPLPFLSVCGRALGLLLYSIHWSRRRVVLTNLQVCFPQWRPRQRRAVARAHFAALGQALFDITLAWWASPKRLARLVSFRHRERYDAALAQGPVILLVPHFVAMEIGVILSTERPMVNVYRELPNPVFEAAFRRAIGRFGAQVLTQEQGVRPVLRAIKEGRVLYYLPDQDFGERSSVFAPFFGVPTATLTAAARLARTTKARVIPCFVWQKPFGMGYEIVFGNVLTPFPTGDELRDATCTNGALEQAILAHPEQYFWVHKRFKTRPPGWPPLYR